jgi:hypothetical protein
MYWVKVSLSTYTLFNIKTQANTFPELRLYRHSPL